MCGFLVLPVTLNTPVVHTYTVGVQCEGETRQERRVNELQANAIVKQLQEQATEKITFPAINTALTLVHNEPTLHGTSGAARLAQALQDRSNLGQIASLEL